ncbi:LacI family DNA-binding transcriptional regulator [Arthrobacter sp. StoSoilB5]|uniref:LacI family DNA-binding transcriptional regulator n=1 Tax=Arthrobacter sp. StoSoilB5 TaxID=2830992 RepID=UPI001CC808B8|nr:LacI family DNA-binding transcriptional regulator [Arthrobacter sp. StoSoilB5]
MTVGSAAPATMLDVARAAGVSRATVSRVFTAPSTVADETRTKVMDAVAQLNYVLNSAARSLRSGRSNTIALLVGDIAQPFHSQLAKAVAHAAEGRGYSVLLCDLDHSITRLERLLESLPLQGVDGVILATGDDIDTAAVRAAIEEAEDRGTKVLLGTPQLAGTGALVLTTDYESVAYQATKHLLDQGRWPVALLGGSESSVLSPFLTLGFLRACTEAGHEDAEDFIVRTEYSTDAARGATQGLLAASVQPEGIVASSVSVALGAMSALADAGLGAPGRIGLVACEEVQLAEQLRPRLTTVGTKLNLQGAAMADALIDAIQGQPPKEHDFAPGLSLRESSTK